MWLEAQGLQHFWIAAFLRKLNVRWCLARGILTRRVGTRCDKQLNETKVIALHGTMQRVFRSEQLPHSSFRHVHTPKAVRRKKLVDS